jgi:peptidoglycan lytic transglycosylase
MVKQLMIVLLANVLLVNNIVAQVKHTSHVAPPVTRSNKPVKVQYGIASFYANKFNGRRTANGEIFNQKNLTAASNTLPLNIWVKVTNLHNKKSVVVKITDRMHKRNKRVIDLSKASAHLLGYTGYGLTHVKVEVIGKRKHKEEEATAGNK